MIKEPITITEKLPQCRGILWFLYFTSLLLGISRELFAQESAGYGFIYDQFPVTLEQGFRTEAAGPFFYSQQKESEKTWALPPFFSHDENPAVESFEDDFFYPLLSRLGYGAERRWQFFQLLSTSNGREPSDVDKKRFTLFPIYFQQRSPDTNLNYTAFVPFYGHLKDRLFHDEIYFVMFPIFGETRKRDIVTDNYFYPFVHVRHGNGLRGWQAWPIAGNEHKEITSLTNGFGDTTLVGGHERSFILWPFYLKQNNGIGTDNPEKFRASIPAFVYSRAPKRDSTSVIWPFFTWIDEREKKYHEWQEPWPFVIFTRGEGKTTSRIFPLFSESHNTIKESDSYLWPLYTFRRVHSDPLDQHTTRIALILHVNAVEKNTATGKEKRRVDMWPFFTWHQEFNGNQWLQILAPVEPLVPNNRGIERNWSPLWSLWRSEKNSRNGATSQSLLWNVYRRERAPDHKKVSLLLGLFQYQSSEEGRRIKLFYVPISQTKTSAK